MDKSELTRLLIALSAQGIRFHGSGGPPGGPTLSGRFEHLFYTPHAHTQLELICLMSGAVALYVNGHWGVCLPEVPQVFLPGAVHGEHYFASDQPYRLLWTTVLPSALMFHITEYEPLVGYGTSRKRLTITPPMCDQLWRTIHVKDFERDRAQQARFHGLLMECIAEFLADPAGTDVRTADHHEQMIAQIKRYVHEYYWEDISLSDMARVVHYSPGYLNAVFRRATQTPLHRYINEIRLLKARQLLEQGGLLVKQVSQAVGFRDPLYFSRMFKRHFGRSPRAWTSRRNSAARRIELPKTRFKGGTPSIVS